MDQKYRASLCEGVSGEQDLSLSGIQGVEGCDSVEVRWLWNRNDNVSEE